MYKDSTDWSCFIKYLIKSRNVTTIINFDTFYYYAFINSLEGDKVYKKVDVTGNKNANFDVLFESSDWVGVKYPVNFDNKHVLYIGEEYSNLVDSLASVEVLKEFDKND